MKPIEEQIADLDFRNDSEVISFYEENQLYFDNYRHISDKFKVERFVDLKLSYADCLFNKKHLDKAINILEEVDELLQKLDKDLKFRQEADQNGRFLRAMIYSKQRKFGLSYPMFRRLTDEDPNHYYYQLWLADAKVGRMNWLFNTATVIGAALILGEVFFSINDISSIDFYLLGIGIVGVSYLSQKGLTLYFEKKKKQLSTTNKLQ